MFAIEITYADTQIHKLYMQTWEILEVLCAKIIDTDPHFS